MKEGVAGSETFLLFLTKGVLTREFVQLEIRTALGMGKPIVLVHETDPRRGFSPIGDLIQEAPEDIRVIFNDSVAVPHSREAEYRRVMLAKILRDAALPVPKSLGAAAGIAAALPSPGRGSAKAESPAHKGGPRRDVASPKADREMGMPVAAAGALAGTADVVALTAQLEALQQRVKTLESTVEAQGRKIATLGDAGAVAVKPQPGASSACCVVM